MRFIYTIILTFGWWYLSKAFHWPFRVAVVAGVMTIVFAFYLSRVIEDDRQ
jgi:hypothetical protein